MGRQAVEVLFSASRRSDGGDPYPGPFNLDLPTEIVVRDAGRATTDALGHRLKVRAVVRRASRTTQK
jgi:hypothetical protein